MRITLSYFISLCFLATLFGCARATPSQVSQSTPTRIVYPATWTPTVPPGTATPDYSIPNGSFSPSNSGQATGTPLPPDKIPPSLVITKLVPFTHKPTGISGLRPENWELFSGENSFQVSSSPEAPDGFIGTVIPPSRYPGGNVAEMTKSVFLDVKTNTLDGPKPEVFEEKYENDGSGTLLASVTGHAQGSLVPFRYMRYARTRVTSKGLLLAFAEVPRDQYDGEAPFIRQMVDSLQLTEQN